MTNPDLVFIVAVPELSRFKVIAMGRDNEPEPVRDAVNIHMIRMFTTKCDAYVFARKAYPKAIVKRPVC